MMTNSLNGYSSVWVIDTEFQQSPGEANVPVCLCAAELHSGRRLELFFDHELDNPFRDVYHDCLFVAYNGSAEWKTFLSLGWELPNHILDLYFEFLNGINGVWRGGVLLRNIGTGLVDALAEFGEDSLDFMPTYCLPGSTYTTLTVNQSVIFTAHRDENNLANSLSCLTVYGDRWAGGELAFPRFGYHVNLRPGDLLICDSSELHGNLGPLLGKRYSAVAYIRQNLVNRSA